MIASCFKTGICDSKKATIVQSIFVILLYDEEALTWSLAFTHNELNPEENVVATGSTIDEILENPNVNWDQFVLPTLPNGIKELLRQGYINFISAYKVSCFTLTPGYWMMLSYDQRNEELLKPKYNKSHLRHIIHRMASALIEQQKTIEYYKGKVDGYEQRLEEIQIKASLGMDINHDRR